MGSVKNLARSPKFLDIVFDCVFDIQASDDTVWTEGSRDAVVELCKEEINRNPMFESNETSRNLANNFIDRTCNPVDCSSRGRCSGGQCFCQSSYAGTGCEYHISRMPVPTLTRPQSGYSMCQIGNDFSCGAVYVQGNNFIKSRLLTCHVREVELTGGKFRPVPGSSEITVRGELINVNQVRCALEDFHGTKRSVHVSVSNDGSTEYENYQLFIAYDPKCHYCSGYSCFTRSDVCSIGKTCMRSGEVSIYDDCKYCNLDNPTKWSIRSDLSHCQSMHDGNSDGDEDTTLRTALIAACIALLVLVVCLVAAVCFFRGKSSQQRRTPGQPPAYENEAYIRDYFNGRPIPAYNNEAGMGNNLTKSQFPESA